MPFIQKVIADSGLHSQDIQAIAISSGPGSYTGLRIGLSTAKGLCYALNIPLISIPTLKALAWNVRDKIASSKRGISENLLLCPMIDARRMEVYTALYDVELREVMEVKPEVLDENSFLVYFKEHKIYFTGDGAEKCSAIFTKNENAIFQFAMPASASAMCSLAEEAFISGAFEDLALFEPFYLKDYKAGKSAQKFS